jgi:hypothetical protein
MRGVRTRLGLLLALGLGLGCGPSVMYAGPRRPRSQVVVLELTDTAVDLLDDRVIKQLRSHGVSYELLPGRHRLAIRPFFVQYGGGPAEIETGDGLVVCVDLAAGHVYDVYGDGAGQFWRPVLSDRATDAKLPLTPCR